MIATTRVRSPMDGWVLPLTDIPDPVFSQGMAGDGLAINPTGSQVCSPVDGVVICNSKIAHALTVRTESGIDLLMHVGIDTVLLKGKGFKILVADGDAVKTGQVLIEFDLELIACQAASAITPILVTTGNARIISRLENQAVNIGDVLFELESTVAIDSVEQAVGKTLTHNICIAFEQGLHARPAAQMAAILRPFQASVHIHLDAKKANARSMVAVMALGIKHLDKVSVEICGPDSEHVLHALLSFFNAEPSAHQEQQHVPTVMQDIPANGLIPAVIASRGLVIGQAFHLTRTVQDVIQQGKGVLIERQKLHGALQKVSNYIQEQMSHGAADQHGILQAHAELIQDPELLQHSEQYLVQGNSAAFAWQQAIALVILAFNATDNDYMRARVADLRDIEQQVFKVLAGVELSDKLLIPANSILLVDELLPSQLLSLDYQHIAGICSVGGGPSAHAAIIAASLGIPFLVAAGPSITQINNGAVLILDAEIGQLYCNASSDTCKHVEQKIIQGKLQKSKDLSVANLPAHTRDGIQVNVYANLGAAHEVELALQQGAEGCGLLRTEFLFLDRQTAPTEQEQLQEYSSIITLLPGKVLTIRTMDIGGDKPIPYLLLPKEENPAMGLRGIRTSLWRDYLFNDQLRAILRLPQPNLVRILLPMINDVQDVQLARQYIAQCAEDLGQTVMPQIGAMIETPASAMLSDQLLEAVDFLSIGSNDLSQYVLAIDR
ncbi:MAG: phosphoenolpyruvate--protein phosphotransferase, partial [Polaromonas sp.]|nr:phosphoenolpyruvate--protein phosphotransferase [Polaromonas sp.]